MNDETSFALRILGFAALSLSVRILTWLSLAGCIALFVYAVLYPTMDRTIAAALFAMLVYLPSLWNEKKERKPNLARVQAIHSQYQNGADQMEERT